MAAAAWPALSDGLARALAGVAPGAAADVGCGTGRVLAWLAERGWRPLVGVDRSAAMLAIGRRRLGPHAVRLIRQDLRTLRLPRRVDLITCTFATLNYLTDDADLAQGLRSLARNLRPGGLLVADHIPWLDDRSPPSTHHQLVAVHGRRSTWRIRLDPRRGLTETRMTFHAPGGDVVERHVQRHRRPAEMRDALAAAGLAQLRSFPLGPGGPSPWRMLVARRARSAPPERRHG
jgi:SAM-dependent methyltransferase